MATGTGLEPNPPHSSSGAVGTALRRRITRGVGGQHLPQRPYYVRERVATRSFGEIEVLWKIAMSLRPTCVLHATVGAPERGGVGLWNAGDDACMLPR